MEKIAVALSGGIDSLVSAYLLKQQASQLIGIHFITGFEKPFHPDQGESTLSSIADQLDIPVKTVDLRTEFRHQVVDYFVKTYQAGKTPNPCMVCNAGIKFGTLLHHARKFGANMLATGHYVKKIQDKQGRFHLLRGADTSKDQSYFLALLNQAQLAAACFPLADAKKSDVLALADKNNLVPAVKDESQDICFIRDISYTDFLIRQPQFITRPGPIVDLNDSKIGEHKGLHHFTVGQRRGINIPAAEPYYVVKLVPEDNKLVVGFKPDLLVSECLVSHINWITEIPAADTEIRIQIRYRHRAVSGSLIPAGKDRAKVVFKKPQAAITPGQGAVFYTGDEVIGGGWIDG